MASRGVALKLVRVTRVEEVGVKEWIKPSLAAIAVAITMSIAGAAIGFDLEFVAGWMSCFTFWYVKGDLK